MSGGLDSTILLYLLVYYFGSNNVVAVSFDYNQRHKNIELYQAKKTTKKLNVKHIIIPLPFLSEITKSSSSMVENGLEVPKYIDITFHNKKLTTYIPFRNLILSSISLSLAESMNANCIALGIQYGDYENQKYEYWDCSFKFQKQLQKICFLNEKYPIFILAPFIKLKKEQELLIAQELNVPLEDTWTCYNPQKIRNKYYPCKVCPSCVSRSQAFKKNNIQDPLLNNGIIFSN